MAPCCPVRHRPCCCRRVNCRSRTATARRLRWPAWPRQRRHPAPAHSSSGGGCSPRPGRGSRQLAAPCAASSSSNPLRRSPRAPEPTAARLLCSCRAFPIRRRGLLRHRRHRRPSPPCSSSRMRLALQEVKQRSACATRSSRQKRPAADAAAARRCRAGLPQKEQHQQQQQQQGTPRPLPPRPAAPRRPAAQGATGRGATTGRRCRCLVRTCRLQLSRHVRRPPPRR